MPKKNIKYNGNKIFKFQKFLTQCNFSSIFKNLVFYLNFFCFHFFLPLHAPLIARSSSQTAKKNFITQCCRLKKEKETKKVRETHTFNVVG